jgi:hypothetical protein
MASRVIYSHEFMEEVENGTLVPENFDYYFLCEGDSWMDRSSLSQMSLPWALAKMFEGGARGDDALFINLSRFGHTLRHIADCLNDDLHQWLNTQGMGFTFDALLLSAGGNDFIDAALDPPPGQGILKDVRVGTPPVSENDCIDAQAVATLMIDFLDPNFDKLYQAVRASRQPADLPIFLNGYNEPVARNAPAFAGSGPWLSSAYIKNGIPTALWPDVTRRIFIDVEAAVTGWTKVDGRADLHVVPTTAVELDAADPDSTGSSGDWQNEIHPNTAGWNKLAKVWLEEIRQVVP